MLSTFSEYVVDATMNNYIFHEHPKSVAEHFLRCQESSDFHLDQSLATSVATLVMINVLIFKVRSVSPLLHIMQAFSSC